MLVFVMLPEFNEVAWETRDCSWFLDDSRVNIYQAKWGIYESEWSTTKEKAFTNLLVKIDIRK